MSNVLLRGVSPEDLEQIKKAAAQRGATLQAYLWETVHAQAAYLRRQDALARTAQRLHGRPAVSDEAREAVLGAIAATNDERGSWVSQRPAR
jgi:hypothetical protein